MLPDGKHKDVLKLLFPCEMEGDFAGDLALEGEHLDAAQARGRWLLKEMFPQTALESLSDWERVLGLTRAADEPLQSRRDKIVNKLRQRGELSIPYFTALAEAQGYQVEIEEPVPSMADWTCAGDELIGEGAFDTWVLKFFNQPVLHARADETCVDEPLLWWDSKTHMEHMLTNLKPAHTVLAFNYGGQL